MKSWNSGKGRNIEKLTKSFLEEKIKQGYSVNRIAKEIDCNRNSVYKKLTEFGLEVTRNQSAESSRALMIEKFGGPSPFCSEKVKQKKAETLKKKYGVENISQVKEIKDKIKQTNLKKYGVESYLSTEDAKQKSREKKNFDLFIQGFCGKNVFLRLEILFAGLWTASGWLRKKPLPLFQFLLPGQLLLEMARRNKGGKERINVSDLQNDFRGSILRWRFIPPEASFSALQWNNLNLKKTRFH